MGRKKLTVHDYLQCKGKRQLSVMFVHNAEEAVAAEEAGIDMTYSCRAGACSSCVAQIISGTLDQSDQSFLDDEQLKEGYSLLCVSYATSELVVRTNCEEELW